MKFVRYSAAGHATHGILDGDTVLEISGPPTGRYTETGATASLSSVQLLAPIVPGDVYAMAVNFHSHTGGAPTPTQPEPFLKPSSSVVGPGSMVVLPANAGKVDEEGEMVVVIGRRMRNVSADDALSYVLGYTIGHDISAREWQSGDRSWWRAKGSDTFSPIGPFIETDYDPHGKNIVVTVNGEEVQNCNTEEMIFNTQECLSFISKTNTLEPGDIVFTGTSGVTSRLRAGDSLVTSIDGLGELHNSIA
ncbi:MAG: fumarylacetoacetate hydrolase family protein [Chloroflexi bacterium]|nr:fumarylacetoacetate hydrolase family protein [Chloroflexota bacterium]